MIPQGLNNDQVRKLEDIESASSSTLNVGNSIDEPVEEVDEENGDVSEGNDSPNEFHTPPVGRSGNALP